MVFAPTPNDHQSSSITEMLTFNKGENSLLGSMWGQDQSWRGGHPEEKSLKRLQNILPRALGQTLTTWVPSHLLDVNSLSFLIQYVHLLFASVIGDCLSDW